MNNKCRIYLYTFITNTTYIPTLIISNNQANYKMNIDFDHDAQRGNCAVI